jgi:hypothetical protein
MSKKPFVTFDGKEFLIVQSVWRSRTVVLAINLDTGKVQNLTPTDSWALFTAKDNYIIANKGSLKDISDLVSD